MSRVFGHPSAQELLKEVAELFRKKKLFFSLHKHVVFVCGGNKRTSLRSKFITYIKSKPSDLSVFKAEDAVRDLLSHNNPEFVNVGEFEELIGNVFDSVLIFPESPGSMAELGFFSKNENIRKKTLVVNWLEYQGESFINLGPVALIDSESVFRPTVYLGKPPSFNIVVDRLLKFTSIRKNRNSFIFQAYKDLDQRTRLIIVIEIINICRVIKVEELEEVVKYVFYSVDSNELKRIVSILCAAGYVERDSVDTDYLKPAIGSTNFIDYEHYDISAITAKVTLLYKRLDPASLEVVQRNSK